MNEVKKINIILQSQIKFFSSAFTFQVKAEKGKSYWEFKGKEKYELNTFKIFTNS